tara:strand:- start:276 stop:1091 length:816 start_codon:yes stop_codon:yes gene_type:complete
MPQFARGTDAGNEFKRKDESFYKGIVVKNWDPHKLFRVKIYVPEISNQPLEDWLNEFRALYTKFPGRNNIQDNWRDTEMFEEISKFLPWAEPCFSLFGENSPGRYYAQRGIAMTVDSNYASTWTKNNTEPPTVESGPWGPSFLYENYQTNAGDYFTSPTEKNNYSANNNPFSYHFRPSNQVDKAKGLFSVPSVGSQVWLFHYRGDYNFPVYFGGRHNRRENILVTNEDALEKEKDPNAENREINQSLDYPGIFENYPSEENTVLRDSEQEE